MGNVPWYAEGVNQGFFWTPQDTHAHSGIDLNTYDSTPSGVGVPITAPFDGTQVSQGTEAWGGQENELITDQQGNNYVLSWLHMQDETPIAPGSPIHAGDLLGHSGTPPPGFGNGPHIHFEQTYGKTPAYMGYNPWYPRATSFPVNPSPLLAQVNAKGQGGVLGGAGGGIGPSLLGGGLGNTNQLGFMSGNASQFGGGPSVINIDLNTPFQGLEAAVARDISNVQKDVADGLKRIAVFIIGLILFAIGLYVLFHPEVQGAENIAKGLIHTPGDFIRSITGGGGKSAPGGSRRRGRRSGGGAAPAPEAEAAAPEAGAAGVVDAVPAAAVAAA